MSLTIYAPASMGNISVGFDLLGAALAPIDGSLLGDRIRVDWAKQGIVLTNVGIWADKLPTCNEQNIVYQAAAFFLDLQKSDKGLVIELEKNLPIGSGLGSSASSVVAAFCAFNQLFDEPYSPQELLAFMGQFEARISGSLHYDNVAPCYLGGMQLMLQLDNRICEPLPAFDNWYWVVAYSGESLSTAKMRCLLPENYPRNTCIDYGRHLASFVHACYRQDSELALDSLKDVIAEPYRAEVIPGYLAAKAKMGHLGMAVTGISGSGPTLFSVTQNEDLAQQAADWLANNYCNEAGFVHVCQLDYQGARRV